MDINMIQTMLEIKYYKGLQHSLSKNNITQNDWLDKHVEYLTKNLSEEISLTESQTENQKNIEKKKEPENTNPNHQMIFSDEDLYKKSWIKLNAIHKILKVKEFVNGLKIESEQDRVKLRDELVDLIKTKVLTRKDKVNYDEINGKIISLTNLQYKNGKYYYMNE
jgi:hypothetical protein